MSIVTLNQKSFARYGNHSVPIEGFSLNGKTRFVGPGQVCLGRSVTRTPFKGTEPKGHGGGGRCRVGGIKGRSSRCDSTNEYVKSVHNSGSCLTLQDRVKKTTVDYRGLYALARMETLNKKGCHWVQPIGLDVSDVRLPACKPIIKEAICPAYTKQTKEQMDYHKYMWFKKGQVFLCAKPQWPPRVNNSGCNAFQLVPPVA